MCYPHGGVVDDLLVINTMMKILLSCKRCKFRKDLEWINRLKDKFNVEIKDTSQDTCILALQGPSAQKILQKLVDIDLSEIKFSILEME